MRYRTGTAGALITLEHRFYTDWYPSGCSALGSVVHVDFSYARDAVPGEDRFQITVETRQGF